MPSSAATNSARHERRLLLTVPLLGLPNLTGAVLVFFFQNYLVPQPGTDAASLHRTVTTFVAYLAFSFPLAGMGGYLIIRPMLRWIREGRQPTAAERVATVTAPRRMGAMGFAFWIGALVVFGSLAFAEDDSGRQIARDAGATFLGGLTVAVLSALLVESWLRPIVAIALAGTAPPHPRRTAGIAPKMLFSWALGSGVPLLAIATSQLQFDRALPRPSPAALAFLAVVGLGSGALLLALASRSVARPIDAVRHALERVQRGDVEVEVPVDDAGQVGELQAGFNAMVRGLRERRMLEDLFGRYVGPEVAADALARGADLGGEEREVSALFVDIAHSTELTHSRDPAAVVGALNDFFHAVVSVITDHGGWVNKFQGDGALCVFGAPMDQPDHATRALRAARQLRDELAALQRARPELSAGIGVSTGVVVAGHVGAVERFEYTIIGDAVNEAARLVDEAKDASSCVLASGATVDAADDEERARWERTATLQLRGRATPTEAWTARPAT